MGVKGLFSIIKGCADAYKNVSIKEMADEHRNTCGSADSQPIIVVDGSNFVCSLYSSDKYSLDSIYGGQWLQFVTILRNAIGQFENIGVKPVFIFDGTICWTKRKEWIQRRNMRGANIATLFRCIIQNDTEGIRKHTELPAFLRILGRFALLEAGAEVHQTNREIDPDNFIVDYAQKNGNVFAILSDDSDFMVYDTKAHLSVSLLDFNTMKTVHYDRKILAENYLGIQVKQLRVLSCLMGNDSIPFETLKGFRRDLMRNKFGNERKRIKKKGNTWNQFDFLNCARKICDIIKKENWTGDFDKAIEESKCISEKLLHGRDSEFVCAGLKSYEINTSVHCLRVKTKVDPEVEKAVYDKHFNCQTVCIYNLFCKLEYGSIEVLEDDSKLPCALVYREIRQRCYGVLFNCFLESNCAVSAESADGIIIEERCYYKGNDLNQPELVKPLPLQTYPAVANGSQIPRIEDLWFKSTEEEKLKIFWCILQVPMEFEVLQALPADNIVLTCILNYLIGGLKSGPVLEPFEVAIILAQALWKPSVEDLERLQPPPVNATAVNLATLFICGLMAVLMARETCDSPFPLEHAMPWRFFDGKLLHHVYYEAKRNPTIHGLCNNQEKIIENFYKLLPAVTNNTVYAVGVFNWKDVFEDFESN